MTKASHHVHRLIGARRLDHIYGHIPFAYKQLAAGRWRAHTPVDNTPINVD